MISLLNNLLWIEELLPPEVEQKKMFGGVAYYLDDKLILILIESSKTREHKGREFPFEIWNGCLFPIEKIKQSTVFGRFTFLENHPASQKWLYLPADTEEFEEKIKLVLREINKRNPLFGLPLNESASQKRSRLNRDVTEEVDTLKPSLFNLDPPKKVKPLKKPKADKKTSKKVKADKKGENQMLLSVLQRKST